MEKKRKKKANQKGVVHSEWVVLTEGSYTLLVQHAEDWLDGKK